jgi:hypothetical protein
LFTWKSIYDCVFSLWNVLPNGWRLSTPVPLFLAPKSGKWLCPILVLECPSCNWRPLAGGFTALTFWISSTATPLGAAGSTFSRANRMKTNILPGCSREQGGGRSAIPRDPVIGVNPGHETRKRQFSQKRLSILRNLLDNPMSGGFICSAEPINTARTTRCTNEPFCSVFGEVCQ